MPKQKLTNILKWSMASLSVVGLALTYVGPAYAEGEGNISAFIYRLGHKIGLINPGSVGGLGAALINLLGSFFGLIAEIIRNIIMPIVLQVLTTLLSSPNWIFSPSAGNINNIVDIAHGAALTLANGFLLLGLVVASAAIILRVAAGTYNIKKFLGSFLIMAVLANISMPIFNALLDIGTSLFNSVNYLFSGSFGIDTTKILSYLTDLANLNITPFVDDTAGTVLVLVTMAISCWVLVKLALLLIERTITLFILLVISPISFGLSVLPTTQKMASQWFENVIKWILVMPMTYATLALGIFVLKNISESGGASALLASPIHIAAAGPDFEIKNLMLFIIGLTIIYMGATVPKMLKIGGALTGLVDSPGKMIGMGSKAGKFLADTFTGKGNSGKAMDTMRGISGAALNLISGSKGPFGLPGMGKVLRLPPALQDFGKKAGSIIPTISKIKSGLLKNAETDRNTQVMSNIGNMFNVPGVGRVAMQSAAAKGWIKGQQKDFWDEAHNRARSSASVEETLGAIKESKTFDQWWINKTVASERADRLLRSNDTQDKIDGAKIVQGLATMKLNMTPERQDWETFTNSVASFKAVRHWPTTNAEAGRILAAHGGPLIDPSTRRPWMAGTDQDQSQTDGSQQRASQPGTGAENAALRQKVEVDAELEQEKSRANLELLPQASGIEQPAHQLSDAIDPEGNAGTDENIQNMMSEATVGIDAIATAPEDNKAVVVQQVDARLQQSGFTAAQAGAVTQLGTTMSSADAHAMLMMQTAARTQTKTLLTLIKRIRALQKDSDAAEQTLKSLADERTADSPSDHRVYGETIQNTITNKVNSASSKGDIPANMTAATYQVQLEMGALAAVQNVRNQVFAPIQAKATGAPAPAGPNEQELNYKVYDAQADNGVRPTDLDRDQYAEKASQDRRAADISVLEQVMKNQGYGHPEIKS